MKIIIICLLGILVFSGYMAITTDNRTEAREQPKVSMQIVPAPVPATQRPPITDELEHFKKVMDNFSKIQNVIEQNQPTFEPDGDETDEEEGGEEEEEYFSSIESEIADVFGDEHRIALAVAKAESGLNPSAININRDGSRDIGIFQINDKHGWSAEDRMDAGKNIKMAKELRDRCGWSEWAVYNNQTYRNFL